MTPTQQIYWHTTVQMPDDSNLTPIPEKVDVAIIGGGFTGLSAARTLAKRGVKAAVLEAETIGWGASSRNGGMTLAGLKVSMESVIKKYGRDIARRLYQCSLDSGDTVEQIVKEENIDCGFTRSGHLSIASKPAHYEGFKASVDFMAKEFNQAVRLVPPKELKNEIGSDAYYGGVVDEDGGGLKPTQNVTGVTRRAEKTGGAHHAPARGKKIVREEKQVF